MRKLLLIPAIAMFALQGCQKHENPLKELNAQELASWIYKNKTPKILACAPFWETQQAVSKQELQGCTKTAEKLAVLLSKNGFGDVQAKDVPLPTLWQAFNELEQISKRNSFDAQKAGEAMKLPEKSTLGERLKQMQREKEQRNNN